MITNAIKHGFGKDGKGKISIKLIEVDRTKLELTVYNTGKPIPDSIDIHKTETFGMQLIKILVEQLNGTIQMKRKEGTLFFIEFERYITQMEDKNE